MAYKRKVGAPKGGRVHWLVLSLPGEFKQAYLPYYTYDKHKYIFYRMEGRKLYDVFIVIRTSRHYWRCTYACMITQQFEIFGHSKVSSIARRMWYLYKINGIISNDRVQE